PRPHAHRIRDAAPGLAVLVRAELGRQVAEHSRPERLHGGRVGAIERDLDPARRHPVTLHSRAWIPSRWKAARRWSRAPRGASAPPPPAPSTGPAPGSRSWRGAVTSSTRWPGSW